MSTGPYLLAVDPGPVESAWLVFDRNFELPVKFDKVPNPCLMDQLVFLSRDYPGAPLVTEMIASYGMPVGAEVFETCVWIGHFEERWGRDCHRIYRKAVKRHLCGTTTAKDANVRQRLIDIYGGKDKAVGRKAAPGPLYGISKDVWSALAVAVTWHDANLITPANGASDHE